MGLEQEFINAIAPLAVHEYCTRDIWILPSVCIAQAALESGWNLNASTLFGIKGSGVLANTSEYLNNEWEYIVDEFQYYPNFASAVIGYYDFLRDTPRYKNALNNPDYRDAVDKLIHTTDGLPYATAPTYVECVCSIIEQYDLTKYDINNREHTVLTTMSNKARLFGDTDVMFSKDIQGTWFCTADALNVREDAGRNHKIIVAIFNNPPTPIWCTGFYKVVEDMIWWVIQFYGRDGAPYMGYVSSGENGESFFTRELL